MRRLCSIALSVAVHIAALYSLSSSGERLGAPTPRPLEVVWLAQSAPSPTPETKAVPTVKPLKTSSPVSSGLKTSSLGLKTARQNPAHVDAEQKATSEDVTTESGGKEKQGGAETDGSSSGQSSETLSIGPGESPSDVSMRLWLSLTEDKVAARGRRDFPQREGKSMSGTITVRMVISKTGALLSVETTRSSGDSELDEKALEVVRRSAPFAPPPAAQAGGVVLVRRLAFQTT